MGQKKRDLIMNAALELFARYGYHKTTISEIAGSAKVGKGTIYSYFENKEEILLTLVDRELSKGFNAVAESVMNEPTYDKKLIKLIETSIEYFHHNDLVSKVMAKDPDVVLSVITEKNRHFQDLSISGIKSIIDMGIEAGEFREVESEKVAYIIDSLLRSFHYISYLGLKTYSAEEIMKQLSDLIYKGLKKE